MKGLYSRWFEAQLSRAVGSYVASVPHLTRMRNILQATYHDSSEEVHCKVSMAGHDLACERLEMYLDVLKYHCSMR